MSVMKDAKAGKVAEIKENIQKAASFVLLDYKGLTAPEDTELRSEFRAAGVKYRVYKNRLMKIALNDLGYTGFDEALNGTTSVAFGHEDIAAPARIAFDKSKAFKKMAVKCGLAEGKFLDEEGCRKLSALPSKTGLLSQVLGLLQAPVSRLARVLKAIAEKDAVGA